MDAPADLDLDIPDLLATVRRKTGDAPSYHALYNALVAGEVTGQRVRNRWRMPARAVDEVIRRFKLSPDTKPSAVA